MAARNDLEWAGFVVDVFLFAAAPVALAFVHFLVPPMVQERYVLDPVSPTPVTLFTAAFLHASDAHLAGNLLGYALGGLSAYLLCLLLRERRWFRLSTVVLVAGLPVLVNGSSLQVLDLTLGAISVPVRGFSGVSAGFGGFAFAALVAYVGRRTDRVTALFAGLSGVLLLLWEVLLIYTDGVPLPATGLVALGVGLSIEEIGRRWHRRGLPTSRSAWIAAGRDAALFAWTLFVIGWLVAGLFPAQLVVDGRFTNVFAHALGLVYGFLVSGWGYRYWRTISR